MNPETHKYLEFMRVELLQKKAEAYLKFQAFGTEQTAGLKQQIC